MNSKILCLLQLSIVLFANSVFGEIDDNRVDDTITECTTKHPDLLTCLSTRAISAIDRASRMSDISVFDGITLVKENDVRFGRALMSPDQLEAALPQEAEERSSKLADLAYDSVLRFLQSHSLHLRMPQTAPETLQRALDEGRAKIKKKILPILMLIGVKLVALLPLALGAIGLMALKALFVGKLALVIAAVIAFQKFLGGGGSNVIGGFGKSPSDWNSGSSAGWSSGGSYAPGAAAGGPYYKRSMEDEPHRFAYSAHVPENQ